MRSSRHTRGRALARLPLAVAVCLGVQAMGVARAQEAGAADATAQAQAQSQAQADPQQREAKTLGAVIVTAQKREENLQKVPISLQAVGQEQLEQHDVADFDDYAKLIPSLSYGTAGGGVF